MRGFVIIIAICLIIFFSSVIISAGIFDSFEITGKASNQPTNVSVSVTGVSQAQIIFVSSISNQNPTEASYTDVLFSVHVYDPDGVSDLNDSSVKANFTRGGEPVRQNLTCTLVNDFNLNSANYSCSVKMWYFDDAGGWNVSVSASDLGNLSTVYNSSTSFTYNQLKSLIISPNSLSWSTLTSGSINQTSNNDPTLVNNTGNYNGTINVNAINLLGETTPSSRLDANNFTAFYSDPVVCASGINLVNATSTTITGTFANRGNLSIGSGIGQEEIFYCIPKVPLISSQTYSTTQGGSWAILY